jgi:hypothetical protein
VSFCSRHPIQVASQPPSVPVARFSGKSDVAVRPDEDEGRFPRLWVDTEPPVDMPAGICEAEADRWPPRPGDRIRPHETGARLPSMWRLLDQINPTLCSIVLITESIFPFNTCLARLRVKPLAAWKGVCDGIDRA